MTEYRLGEVESRFAELIWANAPLSSAIWRNWHWRN